MPGRILVVDDEEDLRRILQLSLEHAGYEVTTASNGREALDSMLAASPDLIVLDIMMPGMSGLEVLQQLKADEATHAIPVVMLTAAATFEDMQEGWAKGTDLYLTKPINPALLIEYIRAILAN